jgi:hypothetical protein
MLVKLILVSFPTVFGHQELIGFGDIIHKAADAITENEITWRPARVIVRHICAFELAVESLLNIPEYGKVIYIVSTLISHNIPLSGSILLFFLSIFQIIDFAMAQMTFQFPCGGR